MMSRLKTPKAPMVSSIKAKRRMRREANRSASQPPTMAPAPSPSMKIATMALTESRSTPYQPNSTRCQAIW